MRRIRLPRFPFRWPTRCGPRFTASIGTQRVVKPKAWSSGSRSLPTAVTPAGLKVPELVFTSFSSSATARADSSSMAWVIFASSGDRPAAREVEPPATASQSRKTKFSSSQMEPIRCVGNSLRETSTSLYILWPQEDDVRAESRMMAGRYLGATLWLPLALLVACVPNRKIAYPTAEATNCQLITAEMARQASLPPAPSQPVIGSEITQTIFPLIQQVWTAHRGGDI